MRIPFRLTLRKGGYMGADTPLPKKCVQEIRVSTYVFHSFLSKTIYRTFALNAYQAKIFFCQLPQVPCGVNKKETDKQTSPLGKLSIYRSPNDSMPFTVSQQTFNGGVANLPIRCRLRRFCATEFSYSVVTSLIKFQAGATPSLIISTLTFLA